MCRQEAHKVIYNVHALLTDLKSCTKKKDIDWGRRIHAKVTQSRNGSNMYVLTALIKMYSKCGSMTEARRIFDGLRKPDVVSWNVLLQGYTDNGDGLTALNTFSKMKARGCVPSSVTYLAALKACTSMVLGGNATKGECLQRGREIHSEIGPQLDHYVQNTLIDLYGNCGSMVDARSVFDGIEKPDVVSWNVLLLGYAENGDGLTALNLFSKMKSRGFTPDSVTYVAALKACTALADASGKEDCLKRLREIHSQIHSHLDHYVQSTLIDMYAKCGSLPEARKVFDDIKEPVVVSWNALLMGYVENGQGSVALELFSRMKMRGCAFDSVTYVAALKACSSLALNADGRGKAEFLERGKGIHSDIGSQLNHCVQCTLIDMYSNCGSMADAHRVFDGVDKPDVVSWNALLLGYAENGESTTALELFSEMKTSGCVPDSITYVAALKSCGLNGDLALGRKLHSEVCDFSAHVVTCLVDFYAKSGSMLEARKVFDEHPKGRAVPTWNALLAGYGTFGDSHTAFEMFEAMQDQGFRPDAVTFVCILLCCSHAGLVEKAREYFEAMPVQYGVTPSFMHYTCMVDVLGRANQLNEAIAVLNKMPYNVVSWKTLFSACHKWKNLEIGRLVFQTIESQPKILEGGANKKDASAHIFMAQIYKMLEQRKL